VMNGLMLNAEKSEVLLVGTVHMLHTVACPCVVSIAEAPVECRKTITILGLSFDGSLSMDRFSNSKVISVIYHLRAFRQIRPWFPTDQTLPQFSTSQ